MSPLVVKMLMRGIGTLAGLLGLGMCCMVPFLVRDYLNDQKNWMILPVVFLLSVAAYFIYTGCLVWLRLSPVALRHVCRILGFYTLTLFPKGFAQAHEVAWMPFAFLGWVLAVYLAYRIAVCHLTRWLFSTVPLEERSRVLGSPS